GTWFRHAPEPRGFPGRLCERLRPRDTGASALLLLPRSLPAHVCMYRVPRILLRYNGFLLESFPRITAHWWSGRHAEGHRPLLSSMPALLDVRPSRVEETLVRARGRCDTATRRGPPWAAFVLGRVAGSWARPPSTPWATMAPCLRATSGSMPAGTRGAA